MAKAVGFRAGWKPVPGGWAEARQLQGALSAGRVHLQCTYSAPTAPGSPVTGPVLLPVERPRLFSRRGPRYGLVIMGGLILAAFCFPLQGPLSAYVTAPAAGDGTRAYHGCVRRGLVACVFQSARPPPPPTTHPQPYHSPAHLALLGVLVELQNPHGSHARAIARQRAPHPRNDLTVFEKPASWSPPRMPSCARRDAETPSTLIFGACFIQCMDFTP